MVLELLENDVIEAITSVSITFRTVNSVRWSFEFSLEAGQDLLLALLDNPTRHVMHTAISIYAEIDDESRVRKPCWNTRRGRWNLDALIFSCYYGCITRTSQQVRELHDYNAVDENQVHETQNWRYALRGLGRQIRPYLPDELIQQFDQIYREQIEAMNSIRDDAQQHRQDTIVLQRRLVQMEEEANSIRNAIIGSNHRIMITESNHTWERMFAYLRRGSVDEEELEILSELAQISDIGSNRIIIGALVVESNNLNLLIADNVPSDIRLWKMTGNESARMIASESILNRCHLVRTIHHWVEAYSGITET